MSIKFLSINLVLLIFFAGFISEANATNDKDSVLNYSSVEETINYSNIKNTTALRENYNGNIETEKKDIITADGAEKHQDIRNNKTNPKVLTGLLFIIILIGIVIKLKYKNEQNFNMIAIALIVTIITIIILDIFIGSPTENNSARYMISAIIQSEAAILALVLSLSLVAVQMTASSYSIRTIDIFSNNIWLWGLLCLYIISMNVSLFLLKIIGSDASVHLTGWLLPFEISISLNSALTISFALGSLCFSFLIPYTYNVTKLLKFSTIIDKMAEDITKENILGSIEGRGFDPLQPIMDIINGSIEKHDYGTTRYGFNDIEESICGILNSNINNSEAKKIINHTCKHIERTLKFTDVTNYGDPAIEAINTIVIIGKTSAHNKLKDASSTVAVTLERVGKVYADRKLMYATCDIAGALGRVGTVSCDNRLGKSADRAAEALEKVGKSIAKNRLRGASKCVVGALKEIGLRAIKNNLPDVVRKVSIALGKFGLAAVEKADAENELENEVQKAITMLEILCKESLDLKPESSAESAANAIGRIGMAAAENGLEGSARKAIKSLNKIGKYLAEKKSESMAKTIVESLVNIGISAKKNNFPDITKQVSLILNDFKLIFEEKGLIDIQEEINNKIRNIESDFEN